MGSLSNDGGDNNKIDKKAIGLDIKAKQQLCMCNTLFLYFLAVISWMRHEPS